MFLFSDDLTVRYLSSIHFDHALKDAHSFIHDHIFIDFFIHAGNSIGMQINDNFLGGSDDEAAEQRSLLSSSPYGRGRTR